MRFRMLTRRPCAPSPKFWKSLMMRKSRAAPARSTTMRLSRLPVRSGASRTASPQSRPNASSLPGHDSIRCDRIGARGGAGRDSTAPSVVARLLRRQGEPQRARPLRRLARAHSTDEPGSSRSRSSARASKSGNSHESNRGHPISGARSSRSCSRCAASNSWSSS